MSARRDDVVFHGTVEAAAYLIDPAICGEAEARRRIVALWEPGVRVSRVDGAYVVRLAAGETVAVHRAPGLPLIARGGALVSFDAKPAASGTLVRMVRGEVTITPGAEEEGIDPAAWLDVAFESVMPQSLGTPPAPPRQVAEPVARDVREIIPGAPPLSPRAVAAAEAVRNARGNLRARRPGNGSGVNRELPHGLRAMLILAMVALFNLAERVEWSTFWIVIAIFAIAAVVLFTLLRRRPAPRRASPILMPRGADAGASRVRQWLTRLAAMTRMTRLIGRAHARYLVKMLTMFDEGNLDEALRHAIPLGGDEPSAGLAFGVPAPRSNLTIGGARAAYSMPFGGAVHEELRRRYRDAFQRLDGAGRVEDAAFVLAELLHASAEAVSYLERKGKFRLAAEIAESRQLPAEIVVRQWLLAGEQNRAVAIARAFGAFEVAVTGLEKSHPQLGRLLRTHWASWLADGGRYAAAVDAIWPVEEARPVALAWIDRAIEQGGTSGARMLARRLTLVPDDADDTLQRIRTILDDDDRDRAPARAALAVAIGDEPLSPHARIAARAAVRALVRDSADTAEEVSPATIARLANRSGDQALRRDLPFTRSGAVPWTDTTPLTFEVTPGDAGASRIYDAAVLHEGRIAVAYGESGVALLARDGSRIAHFDQPAYAIVLSDAADRAIVIAPRGEVQRLARIDFAARSAAFWCDARLDAWANDYDGGIWFVSIGREILAVDATAARFDSLWHNPDFPVAVFAIARNAKWLRILGRGKAIEDWKYALPSLTLRSRTTRAANVANPKWPYAIGAGDEMLAVRAPALDAVLISDHQAKAGIHFDKEPLEHLLPLMTGRWHLLGAVSGNDKRFFLCDGSGPMQLRAAFVLRGARFAYGRLQAGSLSLCDDRGRLIVFDLMRGMIRRNLRL